MRKVSVIIAAYNMADYLPLAIDSALVQDYPDFEIVVVDDGSTDNTREVVAAYGDRVRYYHQPNAGVANAYNRLMELAEGEYIHHLDADDVLLPGALSRLARLLDDHQTVGLAYAKALVIDPEGRVYDKREAPGWIARMGVVPSRLAFRELLRGCHITTSTVMLRKSVLGRVSRFQQEAVPGEDWDMWMRVAAEYDIAYEAEAVAEYRIHGSSITAAYNSEKVIASHYFTLDGIFGDSAFKYAEMKGYAYACVDRTVALIAARNRERRVTVARLAKALRRSRRVLLQAETVSVVYEGMKSLLPVSAIAAGRRLRRSMREEPGEAAATRVERREGPA